MSFSRSRTSTSIIRRLWEQDFLSVVREGRGCRSGIYAFNELLGIAGYHSLMVLLRETCMVLNNKFKNRENLSCHERQRVLLLFHERQIQQNSTAFFRAFCSKATHVFVLPHPFRSGLFCFATAVTKAGGWQWGLTATPA